MRRGYDSDDTDNSDGEYMDGSPRVIQPPPVPPRPSTLSVRRPLFNYQMNPRDTPPRYLWDDNATLPMFNEQRRLYDNWQNANAQSFNEIYKQSMSLENIPYRYYKEHIDRSANDRISKDYCDAAVKYMTGKEINVCIFGSKNYADEVHQIAEKLSFSFPAKIKCDVACEHIEEVDSKMEKYDLIVYTMPFFSPFKYLIRKAMRLLIPSIELQMCYRVIKWKRFKPIQDGNQHFKVEFIKQHCIMSNAWDLGVAIYLLIYFNSK
jgi:hypothetical protein